MKQWWAFQEELQGNYKDTWSWVKRAGPDELPERRNEEWQDERTTNVVNEPTLWSSFSAFVMCGKCGATNTWLLQRMEWLQRVALEVHTPTEEICWVVSLPPHSSHHQDVYIFRSPDWPLFATTIGPQVTTQQICQYLPWVAKLHIWQWRLNTVIMCGCNLPTTKTERGPLCLHDGATLPSRNCRKDFFGGHGLCQNGYIIIQFFLKTYVNILSTACQRCENEFNVDEI